MEIPAGARAAMIDHARACLPEEACGLLAFDAAGGLREVYPLENVDHSSTAFTVDPEGHYRSLEAAEAQGWHIGGAFHSHPNSPAAPSRTDVAGALEPGWLHVIVGNAAGDSPHLRGWWISGGTVTEEPLVPGIPSGVEEGS